MLEDNNQGWRGARLAQCTLIPVMAVLACGGVGCDDDDNGNMGGSMMVTSNLAQAESLEGSWHYRSFYNSDTSSARTSSDPGATALAWLWAEGTMTLEADDDSLGATGTMEFLPGVALDVVVSIIAYSSESDMLTIEIDGTGVADSYTDGWEYSLIGVTVPPWGIDSDNDTPSIVGSVTNPVTIAGDPPTGATAGTVGSYMMVKLDDDGSESSDAGAGVDGS